MRALFLLLIAGTLTGCQQQVPQAAPAEIHTLENTPVKTIATETLPVLREESMELKAAADAPPAGAPTPKPTPTLAPGASPRPQEKIEQLPFAPLIAMDPVDGSKVSIRVETPTTEYKNRVYYFSSEANLRSFQAAPETYLKGQLARY
jgi:YHS domain-containing protein